MEARHAKKFNTAGPCEPEFHYMLPVLPRLLSVDDMIEGRFYFVIHAPRQSGKTTFLQELVKKINSEGQYYALYCSLETLDIIQDSDQAMADICGSIKQYLKESAVSALRNKAFLYDKLREMTRPSLQVRAVLNQLSVDLDKELIVFFDEADCLSTDAPLIAFLRQIRAGYTNRTASPYSKFPRSMALVGMRDIRDYLIKSKDGQVSKVSASPFNIKKEALTLSNFTQEDIGALYRQHTEATDQVFEEPAIAKAWYWTEGQPWLVNALADAAIAKLLNNDYSTTITKDHIDQAAELLIQDRGTHIDSLLERLKEPRVINVMDAVFSGSMSSPSFNRDDRQYCIDLGLVTEDKNGLLRPSNKIYAEAMVRAITDEIQRVFDIELEHKIWSDGKELFISEVLKEFQHFFRHGSDSFPKQNGDLAAYNYDEAAFAFMLMAYLQFAFNSSAAIHRQFAQGRGAVDVVVIYHGREYIIEVKLKENTTLPKSLKQLAGCLDIAGESEGWVVIIDRNRNKTWNEKIYWKTEQLKNVTIHVVGC
jgi:hypothetical protein